MQITRSAILGLALGLSLLTACRGSSDNNGGTPDAPAGGGIDAGNGSGSGSGIGSNGGVVHIQDVQSDAMDSGTAIELHGVVVVSIDNFGVKTGDMFIEEAGGGARSGVHVFHAPAAQISNLVPGDIIDIKGAIKTEFPIPTPKVTPSVTSVTEVQAPKGGAMTITKTGHGAVPAPHVLDAAAISAMSATDRAAFLEDWEGVLVTLQNVRPDAAPTSFATPAVDDSMTFGITNVIGVDSNLSAFPDGLDNSVCLASVTGIVDFVAAKYVLYPPSTDQIATGGTNCVAQSIPTPTTVADIQNGKVHGLVKLTGVFVTGVETSKTGTQTGPRVWVADSLQAATRSGVLIFKSNVVDATTSPLGTKVDVLGTVGEFLAKGATGKSETELGLDNTPVTVTLNTAATTVPTSLAVNDVSTLSSLEGGEDYEGVLVQISNVKVTKAADSFNQVELADNLGHIIIMDDDAFDNYSGTTTAAPPALGTCFATVTGLMDVQTTANIRTINPRSTGDLGAPGTCN